MPSPIFTVLALLGGLMSRAAAFSTRSKQTTVLRQAEVLPEYDFIVVGAGTAGLTVADRLTESREYSVLVIEYGYLDYSHSIEAVVGPDLESGPPDEYPVATRMYNLTTAPQPNIDGEPPRLAAGAVVGGSSAVNGQIFMRGSAEDYDAWVWAAGEGDKEFAAEWGWENLLPYFKKSVTFEPPTDEMVEAYNITYDIEAAYGGTAPLYTSYQPFHWPTTVAMWNAFRKIPGFRFPKESASGDASGVYWAPTSRQASTQRRSFATTGHYDALRNGSTRRDNLHLLPGHKTTQVILSPLTGSSDAGTWVAAGVRYIARDGDASDRVWEVGVKKEVIIAAGTAHTPQILQRSGIGPRHVLEAAGADVKIELPGVGENFQDHISLRVTYDFSKPIWPNTTTLETSPEYAAQALNLWETNKTGPYTTYPNSFVYLPLNILSNRTEDIIKILSAQDDGEFLSRDSDPTLISGYVAQKKTLARQLQSDKSTILEMPFADSPAFDLILCKAASRGSIHISPDDDGVNSTGRGDVEPVVDYRLFSNPLDLQLVVEMVEGVRKFMSSDAMLEALGPVEISPGPNMSGIELESWIRGHINAHTGHPVGTASLAPRNLGGVVGADLTVYGTTKLSVADNSVIPLIPSSHTCSTAYAIGEKAADLILRRARQF